MILLIYKYTNGCDKDFILLCAELDNYLNQLVGGEKNRIEYIAYNQLNDIHDVIIAYDGNTPIGCASFKHYDTETVELKRVFVKMEYRRRGISKNIMRLIEQKAKEKGYKRVILETGQILEDAMKLYKVIGYDVIPNYGQYKNMKNSICMEKKILIC